MAGEAMGKKPSTFEVLLLVAVVVGAFAWNTILGVVVAICAVFALLKVRRDRIDLYRRAAEQFGTTAYPVGMHSPGFIADTDEEAQEIHWPHYRVMRDRIGAERGAA